MRKRYASDISPEKFEEIRPLLQSVHRRTKPTTVDLDEVTKMKKLIKRIEMMNDPFFAYFIEKFGEATQRTPVPESSFSEWEDKLPPLILKIWREEDWANYGNGRLWTVNPTDYAHSRMPGYNIRHWSPLISFM